MPNIFVNTTGDDYKPLSYEEMVAPFLRYKQNFDEQANAISEMQQKMEAQRKIAEGERDKDNGYVYDMWNNYANSANAIADSLMRNGITNNTIPNMLSLKKRYNSEILPIEQANAKREAMKAEELKNPNSIFQRRADTLTLKDIIQNPEMNYTREDIDTLHKRAVTDFDAFKSAFNKDKSNGYKKTGMPFFYEALKQSGATVEDVDAVLNGTPTTKFQQVLDAVSDYIYNGSSIANWGNDKYRDNYDYKDEKEQARNIINSAIGHALGGADYRNHYDQYGASLALEKERKKNEEQAAPPSPYTSSYTLDSIIMPGWNERLEEKQKALKKNLLKSNTIGDYIDDKYYADNNDFVKDIQLKIYKGGEKNIFNNYVKSPTLMTFDEFYNENKSDDKEKTDAFEKFLVHNVDQKLKETLGLEQYYGKKVSYETGDKLKRDKEKIAKYLYKKMLYDKFDGIINEKEYLVTKDNRLEGERVGDIRDSIIDDVFNDMVRTDDIVDKNGNTVAEAGSFMDMKSYYDKKQKDLEDQKNRANLNYIKYNSGTDNWTSGDVVSKGFANFPSFVSQGENGLVSGLKNIKGWNKQTNNLEYGTEQLKPEEIFDLKDNKYSIKEGKKFNIVGLTPDLKNVIVSLQDDGKEKVYGMPLTGEGGLITERGSDVVNLINRYHLMYNKFMNDNYAKEIAELVREKNISPQYAAYIISQTQSEDLRKMSDAVFDYITKKTKKEDTKF